MSEILDPSRQIHPPYNSHFYPDLGGTSYDYVSEISRDKLTFFYRMGESVTRIEVPSGEAYVSISRSEGNGEDFFRGYYKYTGELKAACLYLKSFYEQKDFKERAKPDENLRLIYEELAGTGTDLVIEAHMELKKIFVYHGFSMPNGELAIISFIQSSLKNEESYLEIVPLAKDDLPPITFVESIEDNKLSLGFCPNSVDVAQETINGFASSNKINFYSTPQDIREFVDRVFIPPDLH